MHRRIAIKETVMQKLAGRLSIGRLEMPRLHQSLDL